MHEYMERRGYALDIADKRLHHEIYLSDARKAAPERDRRSESGEKKDCRIRTATWEDYGSVIRIMRQIQQMHVEWRPDIYKLMKI